MQLNTKFTLPLAILAVVLVSSPVALSYDFSWSDAQVSCNFVNCSTTVDSWCLQAELLPTTSNLSSCFQVNYQCAEFTSRTLMSVGLIPSNGLSYNKTKGFYGETSGTNCYKNNDLYYALNHVTTKSDGYLGLKQLLDALSNCWQQTADCSTQDCTSDMVHAGTVIFMNNNVGRSLGHVVVGVGENSINAHNPARYHMPLSAFTDWGLNYIYNPTCDYN